MKSKLCAISIIMGLLVCSGTAFAQTVTLLEDDFNDGVINSSLWLTGGNYVQETSGVVRIVQNQTDHGGYIYSVPLNVKPKGKIALEARLKIHRANNYFFSSTAIFAATLWGTMCAHGQHQYDVYDGLYGFGLGNQYWPYVNIYVDPYGVWDQWFVEVITYDPETGLTSYSYNNSAPVFMSYPPLPDTRIVISFDTYGWWTGHYTEIDYVKLTQMPTNQAPTASAGPDQAVNEGSLVQLSGSATDPDGDPLTVYWTQVGGPTVDLDFIDPLQPTFVAPYVDRGGATLTFQLTADDGEAQSSDWVNVAVVNVNHVPVADAGDDQSVKEGSSVTLSGAQSYDPDDDPMTYKWVQISGTPVNLSNPSDVSVSFTAPEVGASGDTLVFELTVSDGLIEAKDQVNVVVENVNHAPIANAGPDQTKNEATVVSLDGSATRDPDGDPVTYAWSQVSGIGVALSDTSAVQPTFTAPLVGPGSTTLVFQLVATDDLGDFTSDEVTISVLSINDPPRCELGQASLASLWPPNHKMIPVRISNISDPDNNQVTIMITGVTQDEPLNGLGDGDTSPDAVIQGDQVLLRAERAGVGNGRVYRVTFTAVDSFGEGCAGSVTVCVPHDRKSGCVDDGQFYDATQP